MQKLFYTFFLYLFTFNFLIDNGILPSSSKWLIELFSILLVSFIFLYVGIKKRFSGGLIYLVIVGFLFLIVVLGSFINNSSASAIILGSRHYFKYLPFFFFPMVYEFEEEKIKKILFLLILLCFFQIPVTLFQRFIQYSHLHSGDLVAGTVGGSGVVSLILVSGVIVLYGFFLEKYINLSKLLIISVCLLIPTTINETKITFIILPVGLIFSTIIYKEKNFFLKFKRIIGWSVFTMVFFVIFIFIYNHYYGIRGNLLDHFAAEVEGRGYLYMGEERAKKKIESETRIGRVDAIVIAFKTISQDLGQLFFGVGVGNALSSRLKFLEKPNYGFQKFWPDSTTISNILWELGFLGVIFKLLLLLFILRDAMLMRFQKNFLGAFCLGWCGVVFIMIINMFYMNIFYTDPLSLTFWFLSGIVASKRGALLVLKEREGKYSDRQALPL